MLTTDMVGYYPEKVNQAIPPLSHQVKPDLRVYMSYIRHMPYFSSSPSVGAKVNVPLPGRLQRPMPAVPFG